MQMARKRKASGKKRRGEMWQRLLREIRMLQNGITVAFESIRNRRR